MDRFSEELGRIQQDLRFLDVKEVLSVIEKPTGNVYSFFLDYDRGVEDGILAGNYDLVEKSIKFHDFQIKREGARNIVAELFHCNQYTWTDDVLCKIARRGRPADFLELLAFGEKYPMVQLEFRIVSLGSVFQGPCGKRFAPYLGREISKRSLSFGLFGNGWINSCRFLVIRDRE